MNYYWLTFMDENKQFLGACIVLASDSDSAFYWAKETGCFPVLGAHQILIVHLGEDLPSSIEHLPVGKPITYEEIPNPINLKFLELD